MATENSQSFKVSVTVFIAAIGVILAAFWTTVEQMVTLWSTSGTYTHAFLIIPIALFLVWSDRERLQGLQVTTHLCFVPVVIAISVGWLLAELVGVQLIKQLAVVLLLPVAVWTFFGSQITRALWFPLAYLLFMVPMGDSLIPPLQDFTAIFSVKALQWTGLPVFWEGRYISIPTGNFEVAEACSGTRYLFATLAFGALYAYMNFRSTWLFLAYLVVSAIVPVIANGIRAYGIIMIAHLSDMKYAVGVDHIIYGWMFFGVVIAVMIWLGNWMKRFDRSDFVAVTSAGETNSATLDRSSYIQSLVVFVLCVVMAPIASKLMTARGNGSESDALENLSFIDWTVSGSPQDSWKPLFQGSSGDYFQVFEKGDRKVVLYVAQYAGSSGELISSQHRLYNDESWRRVGEGQAHPSVDGGEAKVDEIDMYNGDTRRLVWYWYQIGKTHFSNSVIGKLLQAKERILGRSGNGMVVVLSTTYDIDQIDARKVLDEFIRDNHTILEGLAEERE